MPELLGERGHREHDEGAPRRTRLTTRFLEDPSDASLVTERATAAVDPDANDREATDGD